MPLRYNGYEKHEFNGGAGAESWGGSFAEVDDDGEEHQADEKAVAERSVLVFGNVVDLDAAGEMLHQEAEEKHDVKHVVVSRVFVDWVVD